jgi:tetratricopeptide (TPR) repeat protein
MSLNGSGFDYWCDKLRAMSWLLIGRHTAAEKVFDGMLVRWPQDAYTLASRAHLRAQRGDREAAIADSQVLVAAHPQRSAADWFNLGYLLAEASRHAEAEAAFRQALALDPKIDRAWYGLGLTLIHLQRFDEAIAALKRNTELQPMSPYGWYQLARVHMDRHEPEETQRIIRHLRGFEPKVADQLARETGLAA